jgi:di/tricarboxylate transporter
MSKSVLTGKIDLPKFNWWLCLCISIPIGVWLLRLPQDRGFGKTESDWDYLSNWIRHYHLGREFWRHAFEALVTSFGVSIALGMIVQYCITAVWQKFKRTRS